MLLINIYNIKKLREVTVQTKHKYHPQKNNSKINYITPLKKQTILKIWSQIKGKFFDLA